MLGFAYFAPIVVRLICTTDYCYWIACLEICNVVALRIVEDRRGDSRGCLVILGRRWRIVVDWSKLLRASHPEGGVGEELCAAVALLEDELEILVTDEEAGEVHGLEHVAAVWLLGSIERRILLEQLCAVILAEDKLEILVPQVEIWKIVGF